MSLGNGTHHKGPILGSDQAGPFEDCDMGAVSKVSSPIKLFVEDFDYVLADGELAATGWTLTDLGSATSPSEVITPETRYLLINPGTTQDDGTLIQNVGNASSTIHPEFRSIGPMTSTTTLMDNQDMVFETRIGIQSDTTAWDAKVMLGWITTDTTPMVVGTGVPTLASGGGIGFHIGEDGVLSYFAQNAALTTIAAMNQTSTDVTTLTTAATFQWYKLGFRWHCIDADAGTGTVDFFVNDVKQVQINSGLPMQSTEVYSVTYCIMNGVAREADLAVDYCITGISRFGRTLTAGN